MSQCFLLWVIVCHCLARLPGDIRAVEKEVRSVREGNFVLCGNEKNVLFSYVTHAVACVINWAISKCKQFLAIQVMLILNDLILFFVICFCGF